MLVRGLPEIQWHLSPVVRWKFVCVKGFLCHSFLHTFPLHDPWMIQEPLCLLQIVIHFLLQLYLENPLLSWATPLDHGWIFITGGWSATLAFLFIYLFFFPWPVADAWIHKLWMWTDGLPCFLWWHFHTWLTVGKMSFWLSSVTPPALVVNMIL